MSTDLLLICHGQAVQKDGNQLFGWWANMSLSPLGRQQSLLIGERLKNDFDIHAIYTSPLKRACETALLISEVVKVVPAEEHALRELDSGELASLSYKEAQTRYPDIVDATEEHPIPGGEAYHDMHRRVVWALNRIIKQSSGQQIACITHGGPIIAYLRAFMGYGPEQNNKPHFLCRVGSIHHLQLSIEGDRTIVSLNDVAHLSELPNN